MNVSFVKLVKAVTVCGGRFFPAPSLEWHWGTTDCDSSHCGSASALFLPPVSHCSLILGKDAGCHIGTHLPVSWVGKGKNKLQSEQPLLFRLPFGASAVISHTWREADNEDRSSRMTRHCHHPHWTESHRKFQNIHYSLDVVTGSGIRKQIPVVLVWISGSPTFCLITYFLYSQGGHLKLIRLAFWKQCCVFGCHCLMGLTGL